MNRTNLLVDFVIFAAFIIAMEPRFSGVPVHEWLSLALVVGVLIHLLLHWSWIAAVGTRFFRRLWHTSRLKFFVDALLFIAFVVINLSGILISMAILPALGIGVRAGAAWRQLHSLSADAGILLLGLHFALSWNWVVMALKRFVAAPLAGLLQRSRSQPAPAQADRLE